MGLQQFANVYTMRSLLSPKMIKFTVFGWGYFIGMCRAWAHGFGLQPAWAIQFIAMKGEFNIPVSIDLVCNFIKSSDAKEA